MCFDPDSRPPIPTLAGAAVDGQRIRIDAADGARFTAFHAHAASQSGSGIVILPDVRGLHRFYEELALRFAERGIDAVAIDYFARTAESDVRGESFDHVPHVERARYETLLLDIAAAREHLHARGVRAAFTMGFCFGGRLAFLTATRAELRLSGAIGFYGTPTGAGRAGMPAPLDLAAQVTCPILGLFGGADPGIPAEAVEAYRRALTRAGVENELKAYPGAPHSFFDRKAADFSDASDDAWQRVLDFIQHHGAGAGTPS